MKPLPGTMVVLARAFNPSIFSQEWLLKNELVEGGFGETSVTTPVASQHAVGNLGILVIPDRLQVTYPPGDDGALAKAQTLVCGVAQRLPHTPIHAIGVNFNYIIEIQQERFHLALRRMFLCPGSPFAPHFKGEDALFGGYFSTDFMKTRLKLDVKPVEPSKGTTASCHLRLNFNFHRDLDETDRDKAVQELRETVDGWREYRDLSDRIVSDIESAVSACS
jgi:hypothetical protein